MLRQIRPRQPLTLSRVTSQNTRRNILSVRPLQLASALPKTNSPCVVQTTQKRGYAQGPGGGGGGFPGGFPGLSLKPQHQKGEALKEYVRPVIFSQYYGSDTASLEHRFN